MGFFAEMMMKIEEKGLPLVKVCTDIPAVQRGRLNNFHYRPGLLSREHNVSTYVHRHRRPH